MSRIFSFEEQLEAGNQGETIFLEAYNKFGVTKADGRIFDFKIGDKTIELKTDTYELSKTPNFFMEYYSDTKNQKMGGPFRANNDNVDYFVYFFINGGIFYWFQAKPLAQHLNEYILDKSYILVQNRNWTTLGYKIKRSQIKHLCLRKDKYVEKKLTNIHGLGFA